MCDKSWWWEAKKRCLPLVLLRWMVERGAPWSPAGSKEVLEAKREYVAGDEELVAWLEARLAQVA